MYEQKIAELAKRICKYAAEDGYSAGVIMRPLVDKWESCCPVGTVSPSAPQDAAQDTPEEAEKA